MGALKFRMAHWAQAQQRGGDRKSDQSAILHFDSAKQRPKLDASMPGSGAAGASGAVGANAPQHSHGGTQVNPQLTPSHTDSRAGRITLVWPVSGSTYRGQCSRGGRNSCRCRTGSALRRRAARQKQSAILHSDPTCDRHNRSLLPSRQWRRCGLAFLDRQRCRSRCWSVLVRRRIARKGEGWGVHSTLLAHLGKSGADRFPAPPPPGGPARYTSRAKMAGGMW